MAFINKTWKALKPVLLNKYLVVLLPFAVFISLYYTYSLESDITVRDLLNTIIFSSLSWAIVLAQAIELVCKYSTKFFDKSIIPAKIAAGRGEITSIKLIGEAHYDAEETD